MPRVKVSNPQRRALQTLLNGVVEYHVLASKPTDWRKEWEFNIRILRELKQMQLADYLILASCRRTWSLTQEGRLLCGELRLSPSSTS